VLRGSQFVGEQISNFGREASRIKGAVSNTVEDSLINARRAVKRGYGSAEDLIDEAAYRIKRYPLRSVIGAFAIGAFASWLLFRGRRH
jgi:hypothetical protein